MTLSDGDYRAVEDKIVATLLADTGPGGLLEQGDPAVASVLAGDAELYRSFGQAEFPAILVRASGKKESPAMPAYSVVKTYTVRSTVLDRGMDREAVENSVRKITARLEQVLRSQTNTDKQFMGLPDMIEGAEGVLVTSLQETRFNETEAEADHVIASSAANFEIQVPCAFRYE